MNTKKIPLRKCVACGNMVEKTDLFRVVRLDNKIILDLSYKSNGRGAYICKNKACIDTALKKRSLNRALKQQVSNEVFDSLYMELENDR